MSLRARDFLEPAHARGFDFWAGVPCSYLSPFINYVIDEPRITYVSSANEGDAVAAASGARLAGRRGVAIMQNSGLGNAVSPLTSLNWVFRIPVLLIVTLRGDPELGDEPQHQLMGRITIELLEVLQIPWRWFPTTVAEVDDALAAAVSHMDSTGRPFAFVMRKGSVEPHALRSSGPESPAVRPEFPAAAQGGARPRRAEVLRAIIDATPQDGSVIIATTGYTGRELYAIEDRPNQLYVVGSMGCASSLALGLAICRPELRVVVADGDGAAQMRMGNLATIGAHAGDNFAQVVLDNGMHESTGGQATASQGVRFAAAAAACAYPLTLETTDVRTLATMLNQRTGPALAHIRTAPGVPDNLPRPRIAPPEVRARLTAHIGAG